MKKIKRLISCMLAAVMVLALGMTVSAAGGTYTITINNNKDNGNHTYEAYQVFAGDLAEGSSTLTNIEWGEGVNGTALLAALQADETLKGYFTDAKTAEDVAAALADEAFQYDNNLTQAFAKVVGANLSGTVAGTSTKSEQAYTITVKKQGYYLVKDKDASLDEETAAYTRFILQVVKDVTVTPKTDIPTVEKKVKDVNDSDADLSNVETADWQDSADWDIGDDVPFQITGTMPTTLADYDTYSYKFTDTLSKGFSFNNDVKVYKVTAQGERTEITSSFEVNAGAYDETNGTTITITCEDVKAAGVTAADKIVVEYTANLTENAVIGSQGNPNKVYLEYSNNPNGTGTGKTPEDGVIVFTYKVDVNKVDEEGNPLEGAEFTLEKYNAAEAQWEFKTLVTSNKDDKNGVVFTATGIDDGWYRLVETKAPADYNKIEDIYFTVEANHVTSGDLYQLVLQSIAASQTDDVGTKLEGDAIKATFGTLTDEGSNTLGVTTDIENKKGTVLPETGGIGTKIFYVVGALLMIGAAVLFISRRRSAR